MKRGAGLHRLGEQGEEIQLAGGFLLRRTRVHGDTAIEIVYPAGDYAALRGIANVIEERILGKLRFFVPTDPAKGIPAVEKLIERYPVMRATTGGNVAYALRQTPVNPLAGGAEYAANADAEYRPERRYVAINWQARGLVTLVLEALGNPPRTWEAVTLGRGAALSLTTTLENSPGLADDPILVLVEEGPHAGQADAALREELFHRAQYRAAGGNVIIELSAPASNRLRLHPAAARLARFLRYSADELPMEIPAKIVRGATFRQQVGISDEEALAVLDLYFALIEREHGKRAADILRRAAQELFNAEQTGNWPPQSESVDSLSGQPAQASPEGSAPTGGPGESETGPGGKAPGKNGVTYSLRAPEVVTQTLDEVRRAVNPTARGESAERAALSLRQHAAEAAQSFVQAEHALAKARASIFGQRWPKWIETWY